MERIIFIVDDDDMLRMMLEDHLSQKYNYKILGFSTGEDCLAELTINPELIILDFNLDSIDHNAKNGLEILKQIKDHNESVKVIMYSSQDQRSVAEETLSFGAIEYVIKDNEAFKKIDKIVERISQN